MFQLILLLLHLILIIPIYCQSLIGSCWLVMVVVLLMTVVMAAVVVVKIMANISLQLSKDCSCHT